MRKKKFATLDYKTLSSAIAQRADDGFSLAKICSEFRIADTNPLREALDEASIILLDQVLGERKVSTRKSRSKKTIGARIPEIGDPAMLAAFAQKTLSILNNTRNWQLIVEYGEANLSAEEKQNSFFMIDKYYGWQRSLVEMIHYAKGAQPTMKRGSKGNKSLYEAVYCLATYWTKTLGNPFTVEFGNTSKDKEYSEDEGQEPNSDAAKFIYCCLVYIAKAEVGELRKSLPATMHKVRKDLA